MTDENNRPDVDSSLDAVRGDKGKSSEEPESADAGAARAPAEQIQRSVASADDAQPSEHPRRETSHPKDESGRKQTKKEIAGLLKQKDDKIEELTRELETLQAEKASLKDKWLRSAAELENFRKRVRKEWELLQERTKAETVLDMLAVVDDLERAFSAVGDRDDEFVRGIRLIYNNLSSALEKLGVQKIDALNAVFDPAYHMAVAQLERDGAESNQVIEVVQQGYRLGDMVVRPAKVVIAK